jgi:hypothetical protein
VDLELAVDIFDHHALTGGIVHDVMRLRGEAPSAEHNGGDNDVADVGPHLVDAGEVLEDVRAHFPLRDGLFRIARRVGHVSRGRREIEGAGGEPLFVHAVEQHWQARAVEADAGILRLPLHPSLAVGCRAGARIAARDHHDLGMKVEAEFERSRVDGGSVLRDQADAGAGERRLQGAAQQQRAGPKSGNELPRDC